MKETKIQSIAKVIVWIPLFVLFLGVIWQVFSRYVLSVPSKYSEELIRFSLVFLTFLSGAYCFVIKRHIALDLFDSFLNPSMRRVLFLIQSIIIIVFSIFVLLYGGGSKALSQITQVSTSFGISMFYIYMIIPVAGVVILITGILNVMQFFIKKEKP